MFEEKEEEEAKKERKKGKIKVLAAEEDDRGSIQDEDGNNNKNNNNKKKKKWIRTRIGGTGVKEVDYHPDHANPSSRRKELLEEKASKKVKRSRVHPEEKRHSKERSHPSN